MLRSKGLLLILDIDYEDKFGRTQQALFVFTHERREFAKQLVERLKRRTQGVV